MVTSRYRKLKQLKTENGKTYLELQNPIKIENKSDDIWIVWTDSFRTRHLAKKYYTSEEYYWIILAANNVGLDSEFIIGQKIRIPKNINTILSKL